MALRFKTVKTAIREDSEGNWSIPSHIAEKYGIRTDEDIQNLDSESLKHIKAEVGRWEAGEARADSEDEYSSFAGQIKRKLALENPRSELSRNYARSSAIAQYVKDKLSKTGATHTIDTLLSKLGNQRAPIEVSSAEPEDPRTSYQRVTADYMIDPNNCSYDEAEHWLGHLDRKRQGVGPEPQRQDYEHHEDYINDLRHYGFRLGVTRNTKGRVRWYNDDSVQDVVRSLETMDDRGRVTKHQYDGHGGGGWVPYDSITREVKHPETGELEMRTVQNATRGRRQVPYLRDFMKTADPVTIHPHLRMTPQDIEAGSETEEERVRKVVPRDLLVTTPDGSTVSAKVLLRMAAAAWKPSGTGLIRNPGYANKSKDEVDSMIDRRLMSPVTDWDAQVNREEDLQNKNQETAERRATGGTRKNFQDEIKGSTLGAEDPSHPLSKVIAETVRRSREQKGEDSYTPTIGGKDVTASHGELVERLQKPDREPLSNEDYEKLKQLDKLPEAQPADPKKTPRRIDVQFPTDPSQGPIYWHVGQGKLLPSTGRTITRAHWGQSLFGADYGTIATGPDRLSEEAQRERGRSREALLDRIVKPTKATSPQLLTTNPTEGFPVTVRLSGHGLANEEKYARDLADQKSQEERERPVKEAQEIRDTWDKTTSDWASQIEQERRDSGQTPAIPYDITQLSDDHLRLIGRDPESVKKWESLRSRGELPEKTHKALLMHNAELPGTPAVEGRE